VADQQRMKSAKYKSEFSVYEGFLCDARSRKRKVYMNELKISEEQKFFNYLLLYSAKILKYAGNSLNK